MKISYINQHQKRCHLANNYPIWVGIENNCTIYNLYDDTGYCFVVRAVDVDGNESSDSNETCSHAEVPPKETIIDNGEVGSSSAGEWKVSGGLNPFGEESLYSKELDATFTFQAFVSGFQEISLWWTYRKSRCTNVPVEIYDGSVLLDMID